MSALSPPTDTGALRNATHATDVAPSTIRSTEAYHEDMVTYVPFWKDRRFMLWTSVIVLMLVWPWVFFGVVFVLGGVSMAGSVSQEVYDNWQDTIWISTNIANIFTLIVGLMFSYAVKTLAVKILVTKVQDLFFITFISAIKSPKEAGIPWLVSSGAWYKKDKRVQVAVVFIYAIAFFLVTSSFNQLITPRIVTIYGSLQGTELDLSSTASDCVAWYTENLPELTNSSDCGYNSYSDYWYSTCLDGDQMVDVLESGRNNAASYVSADLTSNFLDYNSATYYQLDAVQFNSPIRGVLPIGPDGVLAFGNLNSSPANVLSDTFNPISYEYSLKLQGLNTSVSCSYAMETPVQFIDAPPPEIAWSGTCPDGSSVLDDPNSPYSSPTYAVYTNNSQNILGFWACNAPAPQGGLSYNLYFQGLGSYSETIGNMTCQVSYAYPSVFVVQYSSDANAFSASQSLSPPSNTSGQFIDVAVRALGELVSESQGLDVNLIAESVVTFGVKGYGVSPNTANDVNLKTMENMVQGILEYEATYIRLLYNSMNNASNPNAAVAPSSCLRTITGHLDYKMMGWQMEWFTALYLIPITIVSLTALAILIAAVFFVGEKGMLPRSDPRNPFDPLDPITVLIAACRGNLQFTTEKPEEQNPAEILTTPMRYHMVRGLSALSNPHAGSKVGSSITED